MHCGGNYNRHGNGESPRKDGQRHSLFFDDLVPEVVVLVRQVYRDERDDKNQDADARKYNRIDYRLLHDYLLFGLLVIEIGRAVIIAVLSRSAMMVIAEKTTHGVALMGSESEEHQYGRAVDPKEFHHLTFLPLILEPG